MCRSCLREVDKKMEQVSVTHSLTKSPRKGAFLNRTMIHYVLTYISIMLRHINLKCLHMSILLCIFAVEKETIVITPKIKELWQE